MSPINLSGLWSRDNRGSPGGTGLTGNGDFRRIVTAAVLWMSMSAWGAAPANFLSHGPGAKALAMGEAFTSVADDPSAMYWNPAGILAQPPSVLMEHTPTLGGGRLNFLGGLVSSKNLAGGLGVFQYATDGVEARAAIGDGPTAIAVSQTAYFLPIAFTTSFGDMGINLKRVENHFGSYHNAGQGADVGFLKVTPLPQWPWVRHPLLGVGAAARNLVSPTFDTAGDPETYDREFSLGATMEGQFRHVFNVLENTHISDSARFTVENVATPDHWLSLRVGGEYLYRRMLSVRAGWNDRFTAGLGVWLLGQALTVDYAMSLGDLDLEHKVSITYRFLPKTKKETPGAPPRHRKVAPINNKIDDPKADHTPVPAECPNELSIESDDSAGVAPFENPFRWNLAIFPPKTPPERKISPDQPSPSAEEEKVSQ